MPLMTPKRIATNNGFKQVFKYLIEMVGINEIENNPEGRIIKNEITSNISTVSPRLKRGYCTSNRDFSTSLLLLTLVS